MAQWYVFRHDGDPLGPWSTEVVAEAILSGKLRLDALIAPPGGVRWIRALDVPEIGAVVEGVPTKRRDDDDPMSLVAPSTARTGPPSPMDEAMPLSDEAPTPREVQASDRFHVR